MLDHVLEGQQRLTVDFKRKIDYAYNNLNAKFDTLSAHVKKLKTQVIQTGEAIMRHEALVKGRDEEVVRHHVNAIIEDDFWQVVKHDKLHEGDFEVESAMSISSPHWCWPTLSTSHRSTWDDDYRAIILANRKSAARSKERKLRYIVELEHKVQTLQTKATTLSAQVTLLQRDMMGLTNQNNELKFRLQAMEQQAQLRDAVNEALNGEVQRLKLATGESVADRSKMQSLNAEMFQQLNISQSRQQLPQQNGTVSTKPESNE
ncbi:bZIP transcription factor 29-like [Raphanus sativus]|uniref:BZIP transcription factor 29-like n=1 Tax=Raphanus sativus TaxID=3726 RepID=A0A9W3CTS9_RAPSA|nr:bZIP transcription factor 29-like [Raphanus sativus]